MTLKKKFQTEEFLNKISHQIQVIFYKKFPHFSSGDQEDIAQEVKLKIWKMIQSGRKINNLESYLWKVVYTTTLDMVDQKMQTVPLEKDMTPALSNPLLGDDVFTQEKDLEKKQVRERVFSAIESLSQKRRIVMKLHLTGMNVREIAEFLNWSESRVNHLYYRGRKSMKKILKGEDRRS
jgi:RNA polymerase sigma-70 factor (ECF subfamily)